MIPIEWYEQPIYKYHVPLVPLSSGDELMEQLSYIIANSDDSWFSEWYDEVFSAISAKVTL